MKKHWSDQRVVVTGGSGFLGSHIVKVLLARGVRPEHLTIPRRSTHDLRRWENCQSVVQNQDLIIHLAATVGGIGINREKPGEFFYDNLMMGTQLMEAAAGQRREICVDWYHLCLPKVYTDPIP